jgi:hypothetical protein
MINNIIFTSLHGISPKLDKNRCCDKLLYQSAIQLMHGGDVKIKYSHTRGRDELSTPCSGPFNKWKDLPVLTGHTTAGLGTLVKRKSNLSYSDYSQALV